MDTNILKSAAKAYKKLMKTEYHIVLGRKGNINTLDIVFMPDNFYHLAGFHKLKQRYAFQQHTSAWILDHIIDETITVKIIENDKNFNMITERLYALEILEQALDSVKTRFYSYDRKKVVFATKITADYLAKAGIGDGTVIFSFFVRADNKYCMNSIFQEVAYDYSSRQTQYTVLLKEKKTNNNGISECLELYRHNKYDGK